MWKIDFSRRSLIIMVVGVLMNYLLFLLAYWMKLPFWLDLTGTGYVALTLGPVAGMLVGAVNNLILAVGYYGLSTTAYYLVSASLAVLIGIFAKQGKIRDFLSATGLITVVFFVQIFFCTVLAVILSGGAPGDYWGDMIFEALRSQNCSEWLSSAGAIVLSKLPDTVASVFIIWIAYAVTMRVSPRRFSASGASSRSDAESHD